MLKKYCILIFLLLHFNALCQLDFIKYRGRTVSVLHKISVNDTYYHTYQNGIDSVFKVTFDNKKIGKSEDQFLNSLLNLVNKSENYILPIHKFFMEYEGKKTVIIKYFSFENSFLSNAHSIVLQLNNNNNNLEKSIPELSNIQTAIEYLKPDSFWAFYNQDKSNIPAIDAIKAQFKDAEGILDIDKLGSYLKTKPKELEKYCDF